MVMVVVGIFRNNTYVFFRIDRSVIILLFNFPQEAYCFCYFLLSIHSPAFCTWCSPAPLLSICLLTLTTEWNSWWCHPWRSVTCTGLTVFWRVYSFVRIKLAIIINFYTMHGKNNIKITYLCFMQYVNLTFVSNLQIAKINEIFWGM